MRGGVLQAAHGRLRTEVAAAFRRPAHGQLKQGVDAQGVAVVGVLVAAGDREHAEAKQRGERVNHQRRIAPVADATRQRLGQAETALRLTQQHKATVRRDQATVEASRHLLASDGWKISDRTGRRQERKAPDQLVGELNRMISGWARYFRFG